MDDQLDHLLESEERLCVWTAWLGRTLEGSVNTSLWHGDPHVFFFDANDGEVYAIERNDSSLRYAQAGALKGRLCMSISTTTSASMPSTMCRRCSTCSPSEVVRLF
jgi:hypothetical protein